MKRIIHIKSPTFERFLNFFALFLVMMSCAPRKINVTKNQQPIGLWISYADSSKTKFFTKGKFKDGVQVGKWIYNSPNGNLERIEIYKGENITIKEYQDNGKLALKGKAKIVNEEKKLHFYYYGKWNYYFENGKLQKIGWFEKGNLIKEDYKFKTGSKEFDVLVKGLRQIEKDYSKYRDTLKISKKVYGENSENYLSLVKLELKNDSDVFSRIDKIVSKYGYPTQKQVGENSGIIFFIVSGANWKVKEKYLELFKSAVAKNELTARDLAYFEDKLLVAKEGYQLYGTQYKYNSKTQEEMYYPVKDLSNMNERRVKAGLEVVNLLEYRDKK